MANTFKLGKNIKYFRNLKHVTQEELAEKSDLTPNYISILERSNHARLSVDRLIKIAHALNIQPYQLLLPLTPRSKKNVDSAKLDALNNLIKSFDQPTQDQIIESITKLLESIK